MLMLAACDGTSTPTAPAEAAAAPKTVAEAAATTPVSVAVRGSVVDSSNRPLANITIECPGDIQCKGFYSDLIAEGHDHQVGRTDANGLYALVATGRWEGPGSGFLMNANGRGYEVQWRRIEWPDPACSSDQPGCAITVSFSLNAVAD
jgi:hypothetical protein